MYTCACLRSPCDEHPLPSFCWLTIAPEENQSFSRVYNQPWLLLFPTMNESEPPGPLPPLSRDAHIHHVMQALTQIPGVMVSLDSSRMLIIFYCLSTLDLLGVMEHHTTPAQRVSWRNWIWEQYIVGPWGTAFRPGTSMHDSTPHLITTYAALLSLAALRDDFTRLNRAGVIAFLRACQRSDGSFASTPGSAAEADLRNTYCTFCICSLVGDKAWRAIDVERAVEFISRCRTYEGGYGQLPGCEAQGGTTYLALACLRMAPPPPPPPTPVLSAGAGAHGYPYPHPMQPQYSAHPTQIHIPSHTSTQPRPRLTPTERARSEHWLVHNQDAASGGFRGRTGKPPDSCYCFWGGAALMILGAHTKIDAPALVAFVARCQFAYGGISKAPGGFPDPYHTYLALAAAALYTPHLPPQSQAPATSSSPGWQLAPLNPLIAACEETVRWARGPKQLGNLLLALFPPSLHFSLGAEPPNAITWFCPFLEFLV
ncbi:Terpenoid cyclases/Protein prenyltransferase [Mycena kentingensis (nom. inval.)]|nr:Terpenoid cyclases/Protein prenyltransferase [Mycena kentingensis (nom. inval.)]